MLKSKGRGSSNRTGMTLYQKSVLRKGLPLILFIRSENVRTMQTDVE